MDCPPLKCYSNVPIYPTSSIYIVSGNMENNFIMCLGVYHCWNSFKVSYPGLCTLGLCLSDLQWFDINVLSTLSFQLVLLFRYIYDRFMFNSFIRYKLLVLRSTSFRYIICVRVASYTFHVHYYFQGFISLNRISLFHSMLDSGFFFQLQHNSR